MTPDPYKYFRVEARDLLDQLGRGVLELEKGRATAESVPRLLRLAHTLKGAARVVKRPEIAENAHAFEEALSPMRDETILPDREQVDVLLAILDGIAAGLADLAAGAGAPPTTSPIASPKHAAPEPEVSLRTFHADASEIDLVVEGLTQVGVHLESMTRELPDLRRVRQVVDLLSAQFNRRGTAGPTNGCSGRIAELLGELRSISTGVETELARRIEHVDREVRQTRERVDQLRLAPTARLIPMLERTARDAAHLVGKRVRFEAGGREVRIDAEVISSIQAALIQLVRNAVAHGIESESDRASAGKPAEGAIRLSVARRGNRVAFSCADDGRGVDMDAIRRVAQERGLLDGRADSAGVDELMAMLLRGGVSTTRQVNLVSGRGIGLDVVRESVDRLGGTVDVRTQPGQGTTIEIVVPVSMASLDVLEVEASGMVWAIALADVRRAVRITRNDLTRTDGGDAITVDEVVVPFVPLAAAMGLNQAEAAARGAWSALIVEGRGGRLALGVDRVRGRSRVVSRPLPPLAVAREAVVGAYLDSDGDPRLILSSTGLVGWSQTPRARVTPAAGSDRSRLLVIDDSLTTRMLEQSILTSAGYEVDLAVSGEDGLEKAARGGYALFLVDVEMPGIDGFTFVQRTRADAMLAKVPAILVTSRDSASDRARGLAAGAAAYVSKGEFDQKEFLSLVRRLARPHDG